MPVLVLCLVRVFFFYFIYCILFIVWRQGEEQQRAGEAVQASPSALVGKTGSGGDRVSAAGPVSPVGLPPELAIAPPPPPRFAP